MRAYACIILFLREFVFMSESGESMTVVHLGKSVGLHSIADTHRTLCEALADHDRVAIDTSELQELDLSLIQLLEAARLTAADLGKHLTLTAPADGPLSEMLRRGGFLVPNSESARFWMHQGE
jgi:hypothetical protein